MAVAWDSASVKASGFNGVGSGTFNSGSAAGGTGCYGAVGVSHATGAPNQYATAVSWGASALAVIATPNTLQVSNGGANRVMCEAWGALNVPSGVSTVTFDFGGGSHFGSIAAMSFTGVNTTTPTSGSVTGTTASASASTITAGVSATDDRIVDVNAWDQTATVWVAGGSQDAHGTGQTGGLGASGAMSEQAGNATVPASTWTWSGSAPSAQVVFNIKQAAAGGAKPWFWPHQQGNAS